MRCQLTVAPALPTAAAAVSSFRCSSQSNGHANDTIAPADHALQRLRMAMLDVVENRHDGNGQRNETCPCRSRYYFSCISFWTDFTPPTALATFTASLISSRELTKPLN